MKEEKNDAFAVGVPSWLRDNEDRDVFAAVYGLIVSHKIGGELFTEEGLRKELTNLGTLSDAQQREAFDLIVSHKDV